ncbi:hypothetical protein [Rhodospira trueperi]|uniref:hypothetical protein n=1 Tax=Rhodospira trueperi TaxID=69960 RepID=UPI00115FE9BD|nr:hypothetical protein [Rhodospira trueperi]
MRILSQLISYLAVKILLTPSRAPQSSNLGAELVDTRFFQKNEDAHCLKLVELVLDDLDAHPGLVNQLLEVVLEDVDDAEIRVRRYDLPPAS